MVTRGEALREIVLGESRQSSHFVCRMIPCMVILGTGRMESKGKEIIHGTFTIISVDFNK